MVKTNKSSLLELLESKAAPAVPGPIDAYVVDGIYLLHLFPQHIPATYGALATGILRQVISFTNLRVHLVFDSYPMPSIKDSERALRGLGVTEEREYTITGPEQRRPRDIEESLKSR